FTSNDGRRHSPATPPPLLLRVDRPPVRRVIEDRGIAIARVGIGHLGVRVGVVTAHVVLVARIVQLQLVGRGLVLLTGGGAALLLLEAAALLVGHGGELSSQVLHTTPPAGGVGAPASSSVFSRPRSALTRARGSAPKNSASDRPARPPGGL